MLLFARVEVLGVAWLRIASAALSSRSGGGRGGLRAGPRGRRLLLAWGAVLALMNACFYAAIDRLALGTVAAIEFLPVIVLAALGARSARNAAALALAVPGVYLLSGLQLEAEPLGLAFAVANAVLFALYIVLADRVAKRAAPDRHRRPRRRDAHRRRRRSRRSAAAQPLPALADPVALLAGIGVGVSSSVIPYVADQLALERLRARPTR